MEGHFNLNGSAPGSGKQSDFDRSRMQSTGLLKIVRNGYPVYLLYEDTYKSWRIQCCGSGSVSMSQRYGSGSRSFYHQEKIVKKTWIPTVL
jgi:hypothetical protein